jgi:thiamine pyrophosphokinase
VRGGEHLLLQGRPGDIVSLIPLRGDVHGVRTEGLQYPLDGESLLFGATR